MIDGLTEWWIALATGDVKQAAAKAIQYGPHSLIRLGDTLRKLGDDPERDDEKSIEMGIYFYLLGKMERWTDAVLNGERVNDDIIHDMKIYCTMAQRNREAGSWPG
jgi:hypothetical protein